MKRLLLIPLILAAAACQPRYTGPAGGRKVAVIGDSITNYSTASISKALTGENHMVHGIDSIDLADGRKKLVQPTVATKPDVLVIELGINSAREVWDSKDLPHLEGILSDVSKVRCVIWATPTALAPSYYDRLGKGTIQSRIAAFQASLAKRLPAHPNVHLADWGATEVQHPEWYQDDHLHPNKAGQDAYAAYLAAQIKETC